ncbi:hypothetical protein D1007_50322 [Hordeum vulgare]|nr:hypothetical protein D1007_50322 [Hordeum vulgare]
MAFEDIFGDLPPPADHSSSPSVTSPPLPPPATASSHTSEIITELHTPPPPPAATPLGIHNDHIPNHVKFKLDPAENNYTKWRMFFNLVLLQYRVQDHVTRPPPPNPDADWLAVDQRLMLWIYFTLSDNLLELIMGGAVDAYTAWTRIQDYFLANQGARYLHLTRQYRNLKQGDPSVSDYARRLKTLADGLADIGNPVSDHDLTMQLLHGLDNQFDTIRTILGDQSPLLPFDVTRSRLDLTEYTINLRAAEASSSSLTISGGSARGVRSRGSRRPW